MLEQIKKQMLAMGQDQYEITKIKNSNGKNLVVSDFRTIDDMRIHANKYHFDIKQRENLYIRAIPHAHHPLIFLDDLNPKAVDFLKYHDLHPCCVVETSKKNEIPSLHAWLKLSEDIDRPVRKAIEYFIIKNLHEAFPDSKPGDLGSNDGGHLGRLAGSWNFGLKTPKNNPVVLVSSSGVTLSLELTQMLISESEIYINKKVTKNDELSIIEGHEYENPKIIKYYLENVVPRMNPKYEHYKQDLYAVGKLLYAGFSEMDVKKVLLDHNPNPIRVRKKERESFYLTSIVNQCQSPPLLLLPCCGGDVLMPLQRGS